MPPTTQRSAPSAPQNQDNKGAPTEPTAGANNSEGNAVNRKKQKRREKQAARLAAEQTSRPTPAPNGHLSHPHPNHNRSESLDQIPLNGLEYGPSVADDLYETRGGDDQYYSDENSRYADHAPNGGQNGKSKRKKKTKSRSNSQHEYHSAYNHRHGQLPTSSAFHPPPPPPPPPLQSTAPTSAAAVRAAHRVSKDRIWNTSTAEERERIKEFWLSLEETERRSLVKVEKDMVLKKMKEQQKHSCSCTVCGRKRTAIEEELEVLYDAYYEELEQYANHQQYSLEDGTPIMPSPGTYARSIPRLAPSHLGPPINPQRPARGRIQEIVEHGDEAEEEDDYSEEDEDEEDGDYSEDEPLEQARGPAADFFNFGNSLTVQGGILTVADDLLKNDGKKFIEMMEQLAERRMQREEEAQYASSGRHQSAQNHDANPPSDEEDYDDDEDDEYDSQEDEDYDEDEMETMTEEQRMEEGRRMFQIFAARMFEQRVLTAYREKVARERQEKLLEELADESRLDAQREAKKAKEAQKKKEKKQKQKQAKDEEKAKREAEKAQEEAAAKIIEEQKLEEQRQKKEEQRKKREAEKKAQDEERQRKEAEKQKKIQEAREQQAELERRQREQKEKERKKREEVKKREREEREAKERDAKDRKEREAAERRDRELKAKAEKEAKDRAKKEEQASKQATQPVPVSVPTLPRSKPSTTVSHPPGLQPTSSNHASPHLQVATPAIPKAPTPVRPRQTSFQDSHQSSPKSAPIPSGSSATSPTSSISQQQSNAPMPVKVGQGLPTTAPNLPIGPPPGVSLASLPGSLTSPAITGNAFPISYPQNMPGMMSRMPVGHEPPLYPQQPSFSGPQYRNYAAPSGLAFPPGINAIRHTPPGRGSPMDFASAQSPIGSGAVGNSGPQHGPVHGTMPSHSHSRNTSASFDKHSFEAPGTTQTQPIARPAPIQRPSSIPHQDDYPAKHSDIDDLSNHLGSSALLDDTDDPLNSNIDDRRTNMAPGGPRSGRLGYGASPMFPEPIGSAKMENFPRGNQGGMSWGAPSMPFGTPSLSNQPTWSTAPSSGWSNNNAFGIIGAPNRRSGTIRLLMCQACKQLTNSSPVKSGDSYGYHNIDTLLRQIDLLKPAHEAPIQLRELLTICETEGNSQNGGGSFDITEKAGLGICVKYEPDHNSSMGPRGVLVSGDIGSPMPSSAGLAYGGPRGFQAPGGGITSPGF